MSAIDRAFIRAYEPDESLPTAIADRPAGRASSPAAGVRSGPSAPHFRVATPPAATAPTAPPSPSERRPLSSFAGASPRVEGRFRPALEVDRVRWSGVSDALVRENRTAWAPLVHTLLAADDAGRSLVGVAGEARGAGCTTIAACLARLLVESGKTVALVDGDFHSAGLARSLGLAVDVGWEDVLAGRAPLAEVVIHSIEDHLAVLPLARGGGAAIDALQGIHASVTAGVLRYHYDMVLFDLGAVGQELQAVAARRLAERCRLDGLVLAAPPAGAAERTPDWLIAAAPELASLCLGVVENAAAADRRR